MLTNFGMKKFKNHKLYMSKFSLKLTHKIKLEQCNQQNGSRNGSSNYTQVKVIIFIVRSQFYLWFISCFKAHAMIFNL